MTMRKLTRAAILMLAFATAACAPVFEAHDYAGLSPISPLGAPKLITR